MPAKMQKADADEVIATALGEVVASMAQAQTQRLRIRIDGETITPDDLTFKERKELRRLARVAADDPDAELEDLEMDYMFVALVTVVKQRTDPTFDVEDAMNIMPKDLEVPASADPTPAAKPAAKRRAGGAAAKTRST